MLREFIHIETACQSILKARMKPIISYKKSPQPKIKKPKLITHRGNLSNTWYTTSTCSHYLHWFIVNIIRPQQNIIPTQEIDSTQVLDHNQNNKEVDLLGCLRPYQDFQSFSQRIYFLEDGGPTSWPKSGSSYFLFIFPSFWAFGPLWSFLTSQVGSSFVKAHGLSLLFMEWASLSHFSPRHYSNYNNQKFQGI